MGEPVDGLIIVIGADSHFCYLMRRYAMESGHAILFAYTRDEALTLVKKEYPAAILLEVDQPDTSGWGILKQLKEDDATGNIPIVLCSWQEEDFGAMEAGADAYLRKPILFNDFLRALSSIGLQSTH